MASFRTVMGRLALECRHIVRVLPRRAPETARASQSSGTAILRSLMLCRAAPSDRSPWGRRGRARSPGEEREARRRRFAAPAKPIGLALEFGYAADNPR